MSNTNAGQNQADKYKSAIEKANQDFTTQLDSVKEYKKLINQKKRLIKKNIENEIRASLIFPLLWLKGCWKRSK